MPYPQYFVNVRFNCKPEMIEGVKTAFDQISLKQDKVVSYSFYPIHKDYYEYHLASLTPIKEDLYPQISKVTKDLLHVFAYFGTTN